MRFPIFYFSLTSSSSTLRLLSLPLTFFLLLTYYIVSPYRLNSFLFVVYSSIFSLFLFFLSPVSCRLLLLSCPLLLSLYSLVSLVLPFSSLFLYLSCILDVVSYLLSFTSNFLISLPSSSLPSSSPFFLSASFSVSSFLLPVLLSFSLFFDYCLSFFLVLTLSHTSCSVYCSSRFLLSYCLIVYSLLVLLHFVPLSLLLSLYYSLLSCSPVFSLILYRSSRCSSFLAHLCLISCKYCLRSLFLSIVFSAPIFSFLISTFSLFRLLPYFFFLHMTVHFLSILGFSRYSSTSYFYLCILSSFLLFSSNSVMFPCFPCLFLSISHLLFSFSFLLITAFLPVVSPFFLVSFLPVPYFFLFSFLYNVFPLLF